MPLLTLRLIAFACVAAALPSAQGTQAARPAAAPAHPQAQAHGHAQPPGTAERPEAAQVAKVEGAWARSTVAGQPASAAYMTLTAERAQTLVAARAEVAGSTELHQMTMQGNVMRMRPLPGGVPLPAGQPVALQPGGLHIMLMQLKRPLQAGEVLPLTLTFKAADGTLRQQEVPVTVQRSAPAAAGHGHGH